MAESNPLTESPITARDAAVTLRGVPGQTAIETLRPSGQSLVEHAAILRNARLAAGLSLRALALRAGTSHPTLLAYERGTKTPAITTFLRILQACDCAVDVTLKPRVRARNGLDRGEELAQALELASHFPSKYVTTKPPLEFPRFGRRPSSA